MEVRKEEREICEELCEVFYHCYSLEKKSHIPTGYFCCVLGKQKSSDLNFYRRSLESLFLKVLGQVYWYVPVILASKGPRQSDCKFKASLYI